MVDIIGGFLTVFFTLAIMSFLYRDNPIYKLAEHIYVGVAAGYGFVTILVYTIKPNFWDCVAPLFTAAPGGQWIRIGAGIFGILFLMRLNKKTFWLSTYPLAIMVGTFAALRMTGLANSDLVGQLHGTIDCLKLNGLSLFEWGKPAVINNLLIFIGVICVLSYFFFSLEHRGVLNVTGKIGIYFLMITFGSSYGYTVMARTSVFIGRVSTLYSYNTAQYAYATIFCALLIVAVIYISHRLEITRKKIQ
ncbi:MAG: hypothetical protein N3A72_10775 [bacterium]|nr:hypothetical protein [bacterium]